MKIAADFVAKKKANVFWDDVYEDEIDLDQLKLNPYGFRWIEIYDEEKVNYINP